MGLTSVSRFQKEKAGKAKGGNDQIEKEEFPRSE